MIIYLYGPDSYRRAQKQKEIIAEYQKKHSALSVEQFDGEEKDGWEKLRDFIKNRSLFDKFKLAVVRGIEAILENKENTQWLEGLKNNTEVVVLITSDDQPPKALSFLITKPVVAQEFKNLIGSEFKKFVEAEARARGAWLTESQLAGLGTAYRNDMWGLVTELDKLALSNEYQESGIRYKGDFFTMAKELAYGRGGQKITALEELLHNDDSAKVFNLLAALVGGDKKIQMADYDVAIKSGKLDYETALLDFAIT